MKRTRISHGEGFTNLLVCAFLERCSLLPLCALSRGIKSALCIIRLDTVAPRNRGRDLDTYQATLTP